MSEIACAVGWSRPCRYDDPAEIPCGSGALPIRTLKARAILVDMEEGVLAQLARSQLADLFDVRQVRPRTRTRAAGSASWGVRSVLGVRTCFRLLPACLPPALRPVRCAALRCAALRCAALRCAALRCAACRSLPQPHTRTHTHTHTHTHTRIARCPLLSWSFSRLSLSHPCTCPGACVRARARPPAFPPAVPARSESRRRTAPGTTGRTATRYPRPPARPPARPHVRAARSPWPRSQQDWPERPRAAPSRATVGPRPPNFLNAVPPRARARRRAVARAAG
jgi:hypothetical protein